MDTSPDPDSKELVAAVDWVIRYLEAIRNHPVLSSVAPGEIEASLPSQPPRGPESIERILDDVDRIILPGITHWNHPRFFGYFAITGSIPGIAGELLSAAMNVNAMLWRTSPAATELEAVVTRWLASILGLPPWFATINDTASTATLYALAAARHRRDPKIRDRGSWGGRPMTIYTSEEAHSSVDKAALTLGIGLGHLRKIPVDEEFRMDPNALERAIKQDLSRGYSPCAVVATAGTTVATAVDPVPEIAEVCSRRGLWLHVDAAYAGAAAAAEELRWVLAGADRADSVVVNPHKWLFVPIDCSVLFVRNPDQMRDAFSIVPEYLRSTEPVRNLMDYGVALGRRFRALKLWMVFRSLGVDGIVAAIREHVRLAGLLRSLIQNEPDFEILAPVRFSVVNFRHAPAGFDPSALDDHNLRMADLVNATGEAFVTAARVGGRLGLHAAIGNLGTREDDVRALWDVVRECSERAS